MFKTLKTQLLYGGQIFELTINPHQCTIESLQNNVKKLIKIDKEIELMTVNTKESYQILSKNNLGSVLSEEFENNVLILYCDIANKEYYEGSKEDSFDNELEFEKTYNTNSIYNKAASEDINLTGRLSDEMKESNNKEEIIQEDKKEAQEKKQLVEIPLNEIFSDESCTLCNKRLQLNKFICCLCDNCIMCNECESQHLHPSFKYKTLFLSQASYIYNYLKEHKSLVRPQVESAKKEYNIIISPNTIEFTMRPKKACIIPLTIINKSKYDIDSSMYTICIKNNTNTQLSFQDSQLKIPKNSSSIVSITCKSQYSLQKDIITLELISSSVKIKDYKEITCKLAIDINDDLEEEELNNVFSFSDELKMLSKSKKEILHYIIQEGISYKSPEELVTILKMNDWKLEATVNQLYNI